MLSVSARPQHRYPLLSCQFGFSIPMCPVIQEPLFPDSVTNHCSALIFPLVHQPHPLSCFPFIPLPLLGYLLFPMVPLFRKFVVSPTSLSSNHGHLRPQLPPLWFSWWVISVSNFCGLNLFPDHIVIKPVDPAEQPLLQWFPLSH